MTKEPKDDYSDSRLVSVSRFFYEKNLSKTEIADKLNISITHVNRLLKEAARRGIVKIKIEAPRFEDLEFGLRERFGLRDVRVISSADDERSLRTELAIASARYFEEKVIPHSKVGLGSGRTLFEMVSAITEEPRSLTLYPLAVLAEQDLQVKSIDANTVVNILWFKSRPPANAYRLELFFPGEPSSQLETKVQSLLHRREVERLTADIANLDYYFFSCSHLREESQLGSLLNLYDANINDLKHRDIVGDFLFNMIDQYGTQISTNIEKILYCIDVETLNRAARNEQKRVVLIAGGLAKLPVIRAGAHKKLFNSIITDSETAGALMKG